MSMASNSGKTGGGDVNEAQQLIKEKEYNALSSLAYAWNCVICCDALQYIVLHAETIKASTIESRSMV